MPNLLRPLVLPLVASLLVALVTETVALGQRQAEAPGGTAIPLALIKRYQASRPTGGASAGSCALIAKSKSHAYWLTAEHVIDGPYGLCVIERPGKPSLAGSVVASRNGPDLALIRTSAHTVTKSPFPIWPYQLTQRDYWAEGYAGASFRDFGRRRGRLLSVQPSYARWEFPSIPGESGGCIYTLHNMTKYLCGCVSASDWPSNPRGLRSGFTVGGDSRSIAAFLRDAGLPIGTNGYVSPTKFESNVQPAGIIFRRVLGGRSHPDPCPECYPREQLQQHGIIPEDFSTPPQSPPPEQLPPPQQRPSTDYDRIRQMIKDELAANRPRDGKDGKDGRDGKDGVTAEELKPLIRNAVLNAVEDAVAGLPRGVTEDRVREILSEVPPGLSQGDVESIVDSRMEPFATKLVEQLFAIETPIQLDHGDGDLEDVGTLKLGQPLIIPIIRTGGVGGSAVATMVVVGTATDRLIREFEAAKKTFSELTMLPQNRVPPNVIVRRYPTLVAYDSRGTVAGLWDGDRDVSQKLQAIARGMFP